MFTNWDDSLDINFDTYDSNDFLEDTHSPFYLERAIMNFHNDSLDNSNYDMYDSNNSTELKKGFQRRGKNLVLIGISIIIANIICSIDDPTLSEDWHYLRKIIHNEELWPHIDDLLIKTPEWAVCNGNTMILIL